jgi:hypothetical protein
MIINLPDGSLPVIGNFLPLHPRLVHHGMTRDPKSGQLVGSLRAGAELLILSIERLTPEQKAAVRSSIRGKS